MKGRKMKIGYYRTLSGDPVYVQGKKEEWFEGYVYSLYKHSLEKKLWDTNGKYGKHRQNRHDLIMNTWTEYLPVQYLFTDLIRVSFWRNKKTYRLVNGEYVLITHIDFSSNPPISGVIFDQEVKKYKRLTWDLDGHCELDSAYNVTLPNRDKLKEHYTKEMGKYIESFI